MPMKDDVKGEAYENLLKHYENMDANTQRLIPLREV